MLGVRKEQARLFAWLFDYMLFHWFSFFLSSQQTKLPSRLTLTTLGEFTQPALSKHPQLNDARFSTLHNHCCYCFPRWCSPSLYNNLRFVCIYPRILNESFAQHLEALFPKFQNHFFLTAQLQQTVPAVTASRLKSTHPRTHKLTLRKTPALRRLENSWFSLSWWLTAHCGTQDAQEVRSFAINSPNTTVNGFKVSRENDLLDTFWVESSF